MDMPRSLRIAFGVALAAALTLGVVDESWARKGGRFGAARGSLNAAAGTSSARAGRFGRVPFPSSPAPLSGTPFRHHHFGSSVFFVGSPFLFYAWPYGYYYAPPPYYYGPDYMATEQMPDVYVEKFDGQPTPQTTGEIYCPGKQAYYPEVQDCPNGWQRIIREPVADSGSG